MGGSSLFSMPRVREEERVIFEAIDVDGNGDMDISEITGALKAYGRPSDRTTAITLLSNADEDGSRTLDYPQFKKYVIEHAGNPDDPLTALYQAMKDKLCSPIMQAWAESRAKWVVAT